MSLSEQIKADRDARWEKFCKRFSTARTPKTLKKLANLLKKEKRHYEIASREIKHLKEKGL